MGGITPVHGESAFLDTTTMKSGFDLKGHHADHEGCITVKGQGAVWADYYTRVGFKKTYHSLLCYILSLSPDEIYCSYLALYQIAIPL